MLTVDQYLDQAARNSGAKSDRQLATLIGVNSSMISQIRTKRAWPSDATMVKIARLAEVDEEEAVIALNIWRNSDSVAASVYSHIMDKLKQAALLIVGIVVLGGIYFYDAAPASADVAWYASDYIL